MDTWVTFFGAPMTHGGGMPRAFLVFDSVHSSYDYDIDGQPTGVGTALEKVRMCTGQRGVKIG
jgi:hypothetical protein